jgi:hypothetical protein
MRPTQFPEFANLVANQGEFFRPTPTFELAFPSHSCLLREWPLSVNQSLRRMDARKSGGAPLMMQNQSAGDVLSDADI